MTALTPRSPDSAIAGFDYDTTGTAGLELVTEQLNTDVTIGKLAGSQCRVAGTGSVYRIWTITGDTLYQFASVIDRPVPVDVGITNGTVIVISGPAGPTAPTAQDVIDADKHTWLELLNRPADQLPTTPPVQPIGDGLDVVVELVPTDPNQPTSSLTLRLNEQDGIPILEGDTANAVLTDGARYWKTKIDGRMRLRNTAHTGTVMGTRLADGPLTTDFTVNISTTDGDDFTIQTTGDITLQPQP